ncbi:MAG: hypothetical protein IJR88_03475 [Clostridia bacterium]|nr:hypothetical protein [Clostridia bacterium]
MEKIDLQSVFAENNAILTMLAAYLNRTPRAIDRAMVKEIAASCSVSTDEAFLALFSAAIGLEDTPKHRRLERLSLRPGLHCLDPKQYSSDPYIKAVGKLSGRLGNWTLQESFYAPYEPFVCNHPKTEKDFREIAQIGYFEERFDFPAVLEGGIEWMTVTPNEIETMKEPIAHARGKVLTLGLGLGYYAFHASEKSDVESVTIIERDEKVISLFERFILPRFPHKEKIKILQKDAFEFMEQDLKEGDFDSIFCDLWHDESDGLSAYIRLKKTEETAPGARFDYWIEPTLLASLRRMVWENFVSGSLSVKEEEILAFLSDDSLRSLAKKLKKVE